MKNIKSFDSFINEELSPDTYRNAAEKLKSKGHRKRSENILDYLESTEGVKPIDIEVYGRKYHLTKDNIIVSKDGEDIDIFIAFDKKIYDLLNSGDMSKLWNEISKEQKENMIGEYRAYLKDINEPEISEEESKKLMNTKWEDLTEDQQGFFEETADMSNDMVHIGYQWKPEGRLRKRKFYVDGLIIENRSTAVKLYKFLKQYGTIVGGDVQDAINMITVNDLYKN